MKINKPEKKSKEAKPNFDIYSIQTQKIFGIDLGNILYFYQLRY